MDAKQLDAALAAVFAVPPENNALEKKTRSPEPTNHPNPLSALAFGNDSAASPVEMKNTKNTHTHTENKETVVKLGHGEKTR